MTASRRLEALLFVEGIIRYTSAVDGLFQQGSPPRSASLSDPKRIWSECEPPHTQDDQGLVNQTTPEKWVGGIAMTTELDAILDSNLVTMVFLYGSAAMLIASLIAVTWLSRSTESAIVLRTRAAS